MKASQFKYPYIDNYSTQLAHVAVAMPAVLLPVLRLALCVLPSQMDFAFVAAVARPGLAVRQALLKAKLPRARGCPEGWAAGADLERRPRPPPGPRGPESGCVLGFCALVA